jgi:hypothetical protein
MPRHANGSIDCPVVIETVVDQVDDIVQPVRGTGWTTSHPGDRVAGIASASDAR